jgi:hypothetical protein
MTWLLGAIFLVTPALIFLGIIDVSRLADLIDAAWRRLRPPPPPQPVVPPIQRIAADLRRLSEHIAAVDSSDQPAKAERLLAAALAYDGVLLDACRTFEVPAPPGLPLQSLDRLQTEAVLAQHGLEW